MRVNIDLAALKKKHYAIVKQNYDFFLNIYSSSHSRRARDKEGEWAQFLEINPKEPE